MNRFKNLLAFFAFSLLILGLPSLASAQWRDRDQDDDYYGRNRNGDYRNNRGYNNSALRAAIQRLERRAENFERRVDRELDRSRYDDRRREDRINDIARDFTNAAERLEDAYDGGRNMNRSYNEARRVVDLAQRLENAIYRSRLDNRLQNEWSSIRQDVYTIASAYNISYNNRNGRRNNGSWRDAIPFPLPY